RYYYCFNGRHKHLNRECPIKSVIASDIEGAVWKEIKGLLKTPALLREAILKSESIDSSDENIEELTKLLENKETEEERLLDLYQMGKFDRGKLDGRVEKLRKEKETIRKNIEALKDRNKLDTRLSELRVELEADIDSFDYERKRKVLKILLWGKPGLGVFVKPDYSVDIRGLADFTKLNGMDKIDRAVGIENIPSLPQEH
ncbi:MAG: hypothetical protein ACM3SR_13645, partial [Ignavibacteriales bacterium]